jgi:hypothetical protein
MMETPQSDCKRIHEEEAIDLNIRPTKQTKHDEADSESSDGGNDSDENACDYCQAVIITDFSCVSCGSRDYCTNCLPQCHKCDNHICVQCLRFEGRGMWCANCPIVDNSDSDDSGDGDVAYYCEHCVKVYFDEDDDQCRACKIKMTAKNDRTTTTVQ